MQKIYVHKDRSGHCALEKTNLPYDLPQEKNTQYKKSKRLFLDLGAPETKEQYVQRAINTLRGRAPTVKTQAPNVCCVTACANNQGKHTPSCTCNEPNNQHCANLCYDKKCTALCNIHNMSITANNP